MLEPQKSDWEKALPPNYSTNSDKKYPYSEVPNFGNYRLVKLPRKYKLLEIVSYWGEGFVNVDGDTAGHTDAYNINHQYKLVSKGPDANKKIPNRIPLASYAECDTSAYINENTVKTVILMEAPVNDKCAADIVRIVNEERGKVIICDYNGDVSDLQNLEEELVSKRICHCVNYELPKMLAKIGNEFRVYLNANECKQQLIYYVLAERYDDATKLTQSLEQSECEDVVTEAVNYLLGMKTRNAMDFAYSLWQIEEKDAVSNYFPEPIERIFEGSPVKIINRLHDMALKVDSRTNSCRDRRVWGDGGAVDNAKLIWNLDPFWEHDHLCFHIIQKENSIMLKLDSDNWNKNGDRVAWGDGSYSSEERLTWWLVPAMCDNEPYFFIVNDHFTQALKLDDHIASLGDRQLYGQKLDPKNPFEDSLRFGWKIIAENE